jgi:hypothetical protein
MPAAAMPSARGQRLSRTFCVLIVHSGSSLNQRGLSEQAKLGIIPESESEDLTSVLLNERPGGYERLLKKSMTIAAKASDPSRNSASADELSVMWVGLRAHRQPILAGLSADSLTIIPASLRSNSPAQASNLYANQAIKPAFQIAKN